MDSDQPTPPQPAEQVAQPPVPPAGGSYEFDDATGTYKLISRTLDRGEAKE